MKNNKQIYLQHSDQRHRYHIMIKPIGAMCNLDCTYCYYLHKKDLLNNDSMPQGNTSTCYTSNNHSMSDATLEALISQYISSNEHDNIVFSWQGGEPTLLGIKFFEKVLHLQQKHNTDGKNVANTLQTNGTLLTDDWAIFLKEYDFLVGLSLDGPEEIHNLYRIDTHGKGSFSKVMQGLAYLQKHTVPFTTLTTVNKHNATKPQEVYDFLTKTVGSTYVQFNPCVEPISFETCAPHHWKKESLPKTKHYQNSSKIQNFVTPWSVVPEDWGRFLCSTFDLWKNNDFGRVLVNWFETAVAQTLGLPAQICTTGQICGKGVAMEYDGSVYSCDHYVNSEYYLGNINNSRLKELVFSAKQQAFAFKKQNELAIECLHCPHGALCWGQCPRHRFVYTANVGHALNYLCPGFKHFYSYAKPHIRAMAEQCMQNIK